MFKENWIKAVQMYEKFQTRYVMGVLFVDRRYMIGVPFLSWMHGIQNSKGLDLKAEPILNLSWVLPPPPTPPPPFRVAINFLPADKLLLSDSQFNERQ